MQAPTALCPDRQSVSSPLLQYFTATDKAIDMGDEILTNAIMHSIQDPIIVQRLIQTCNPN